MGDGDLKLLLLYSRNNSSQHDFLHSYVSLRSNFVDRVHSTICVIHIKDRSGPQIAYFHALTAVGALMTLFTLSNARRFYLSMGNPLAVKGLEANFES